MNFSCNTQKHLSLGERSAKLKSFFIKGYGLNKSFIVNLGYMLGISWFKYLSAFIFSLITMLFFSKIIWNYLNYIIGNHDLLFTICLVIVFASAWVIKQRLVNNFFGLSQIIVYSGVAAGVIIYLIRRDINAIIDYRHRIILLIVVLFLYPLIMLYGAYRRTKKNNKSDIKASVASQLFFDIFDGDKAIEKFEDDKLNRSVFAKEVANHIINKPEISMTYGINGSWGSGKTSIINLVLSHIEYIYEDCHKIPFEHIRLESWHYRDPNKLIFDLLNKINAALGKSCKYSMGLNRAINTFTKSISSASLGFGPFGLNISTELLSHHFHNDEKNKLKSILESDFNSQLIIFIDDLDRLDKEELTAIFRAVRLFMGLPKIKFILAYDSETIMAKLFSADDSVNQAGDFLGKIINQEFSLSIPPEDIRKRLLMEMCDKSKDSIPTSEYNKFKEFLEEDESSYYIFSLLLTPREIARVVAATVWVYSLGKNEVSTKHYYFIDLFVLTIIQYRIPKLYNKLFEQHEEITRLLGLLYKLTPKLRDIKRGVVDKNADKSEECKFKNLVKDLISNISDRQRDAAKSLLTILLLPIMREIPDMINLHKRYISRHRKRDGTVVTNDINFILDIEERRFFHPFVLETYFQYTYPDLLRKHDAFFKDTKKIWLSQESTMAIIEENIKKFVKNNHHLLLEEKYFNALIGILNFCENNTTNGTKVSSPNPLLSNNLENTDKLFSSNLEKTRKKGDFVKALVRSIDDHLNEEPDRARVQSDASSLALRVCESISDLDNSSLSDMIAKLKSYLFASFLVKKVLSINVNKDVYKERHNILESALLENLNNYLDGKKVFELDDDSFKVLFNSNTIDEKIKSMIIDELKEQPSNIFQILDIYVSCVNCVDSEEFESMYNTLNQLNDKIPCDELYNAVKEYLDGNTFGKKQKIQMNLLKIYPEVQP